MLEAFIVPESSKQASDAIVLRISMLLEGIEWGFHKIPDHKPVVENGSVSRTFNHRNF